MKDGSSPFLSVKKNKSSMKTCHYSLLLAVAALLLPAPVHAQQRSPGDTTIHLSWGRVKTVSTSVSGARSVYEEDLERSAAVDLRSRLTGLFPGLDILEYGNPLYTWNNINEASVNNDAYLFSGRGSSSIYCIVDDYQMPLSLLQLDPNQIESVTYVSEVSDKAQMGPLASTGVLYIKTKKGRYDTPLTVTASAESGVGFVDNFPEYVGGVDYAKLNNQARAAAGYPVLYDDASIAGFAREDPMDREYPNVDYKSLLLRNWKPTSHIGVNMTGGSSSVRYNLSLNGVSDGDLYKVGPASDYNKLNLSTSVSARVGRYFEASVGFHGLLSYRRLNRGGLYDYKSTVPVAFPVALAVSNGTSSIEGDLEGTMIYAVSRNYASNPYATVVEAGNGLERIRSGFFNVNVDVDLGFWVPGLKSKTLFNLGTGYFFQMAKVNDYLAYIWEPSGDIVDLSAHVGAKSAAKSAQNIGATQNTNFYERLSYDWSCGGHQVDASAMYYQSSTAASPYTTYNRIQYGVATAAYSFGGRYVAEASLQYAGATRYAPQARFGLFPSGGIAWIVSNERFLKDSSWLTYLKLHAQAGSIGTSSFIGTNYLYESEYSTSSAHSYGPATAYQWFGERKQTARSSVLTRLANPGLTWPRVEQVDLGVDLTLFSGLDISLRGYRIDHVGGIDNTMTTFVDLFGWNRTSFYDNYTASRVRGYDVSLKYTGKAGKLRYAVGGWLASWKSIHTRLVSDDYLYEWQKLTGSDTDAIRGYVSIGKFRTQEQIDAMPKLSETDTQVGDLMYEDLNKDGVIDANDIRQIGNTNPRYRVALTVDLSLGRFDFHAVGTGNLRYDLVRSNAFFWNGWGDDNYSAFVRDNLGGDYPRLSYLKSTTNFQTSTFWMADRSFFKVQSAELGYNMPLPERENRSLKAVRFTLRGVNLLTLTRLDYVDPEDPLAGVSHYPFVRTVTLGAKLIF